MYLQYVTISCDCTGAEAHLRICFVQKILFILPFLYVLKVFSEGLSVRELNTDHVRDQLSNGHMFVHIVHLCISCSEAIVSLLSLYIYIYALLLSCRC